MEPTTGRDVAGYIDHTLLRPDASRDEILKVCGEAMHYGFKAVCVNPLWVSTAKRALAGSGVLTCSVAGFPLGASTTASKAFEAADAVANGADEIDMVIDIAAAKRGDRASLERDIAGVAAAVHAKGAILKVIIETSLLNEHAKALACEAAAAAGADFVKTSTGFAGGGATVADVALMRLTVGPKMGVKASGGVRTLADALALIKAGATRLGSSSGVAIVGEEQGTTGR